MSGVPSAPVVGIVIPTYRNPVLLEEAISSVLCQSDEVPAITLIVNDGCPMKETKDVIQSFVAAYPDQLLSIQTEHSGNGLARDRGANLLLRRFSSVEAVCFLDAENRLETTAFLTFARVLDSFPDHDWFYPPVAMFGLSDHRISNEGASLPADRNGTIGQTGSLVRRRVFESGICFCEKLGVSRGDGNFFLSAAEAGFQGKSATEPFLQFRKRPGRISLSDQAFVDSVRSKRCYGPKVRVVFSDSGRIASFSDPHFAYLVSVTEERWQELASAGMIRFVLWEIERNLNKFSGIAAVAVKLSCSSKGGIALGERETISDCQALTDSDLVAVRMGVLEEAVAGEHEPSINSIFFPVREGQGVVMRRVLRSDFFTENLSNLDQSKAIVSLVQSLRTSDCRLRGSIGDGEKDPYFPADRDPLSICFLLPIAEFGGVETIALNLAIAMKARGWRTAICIIGTNPIRMAEHPRRGFDEILWFPESKLLKWSGASYGGTKLCLGAEGDDLDDLLGLLGSFGVVMGCHPSGAAAAFGELQKLGVVTALHEHVMEVGKFQRTFGPPMLALGYEEAVDVIATGSTGLSHWLHAQGVPSSKLVPIPNAAGFSIPDEMRLEILRKRRVRIDSPLRCLFIGRLDRQKGMDRLTDLIRETRTRDIDVIWRVVGKPVLNDDPEGLRRLMDEAKIEDPAYEVEARSGMYAWADVVVIPSRYEGLPLTVLEAQMLGAVPIMTRVGDYAEAIEHGFNGILVEEETCVEAMASVIKVFLYDRVELARISENAARSNHTWEEASQAFESRLRDEVEIRRSAYTHSRT